MIIENLIITILAVLLVVLLAVFIIIPILRVIKVQRTDSNKAQVILALAAIITLLVTINLWPPIKQQDNSNNQITLVPSDSILSASINDTISLNYYLLKKENGIYKLKKENGIYKDIVNFISNDEITFIKEEFASTKSRVDSIERNIENKIVILSEEVKKNQVALSKLESDKKIQEKFKRSKSELDIFIIVFTLILIFCSIQAAKIYNLLKPIPRT